MLVISNTSSQFEVPPDAHADTADEKASLLLLDYSIHGGSFIG